MRCFYHTEAEAVGICKTCNKGLCRECAAEVGNGLACVGRCEEEVRLLNQLMTRAKGAYQTAGSAYQTAGSTYSRYAIVFLLFGLVFLVSGVIALFSRSAYIALFVLPMGLIMLLAAFISYSAGRRLRKLG